MIQDSTGTDNMHDPPWNQMENNDDESTCVPNEEGSEEDDDSILSIESLNEVAIHHNTDGFEPTIGVTDTTNTTTTTVRDDNDTSVAAKENIPEEEGIASDTMTAGVHIPGEDMKEDSSFTARVIM
eukprot:3966615-Ditylum_brightwellii.AAC.1